MLFDLSYQSFLNFNTSESYPNPTGKIFLSPHHRGSNKLRKLGNLPQATEPENTHLGLSYLCKLSSTIANDTTMGLNNESFC